MNEIPHFFIILTMHVLCDRFWHFSKNWHTHTLTQCNLLFGLTVFYIKPIVVPCQHKWPSDKKSSNTHHFLVLSASVNMLIIDLQNNISPPHLALLYMTTREGSSPKRHNVLLPCFSFVSIIQAHYFHYCAWFSKWKPHGVLLITTAEQMQNWWEHVLLLY